MARDKTDKTDLTPDATTATQAANPLVWERVKIGEDELSELWMDTAKIENSDQAKQAAHDSQADNFWPFIEDFANFCDEKLRANGFPCAAEMVRHDGAGKWWLHPPESPKYPQKGEIRMFVRGYALAEKFADDFSDAWYAGRIGWKCRVALEHFRNGDAGKPFLFIMLFEIATLRTDWRWRRGNKPSILTGRKQRKTLAAHRSTAHANQREVIEARRDAITSLLRERKRNISGGALERYLEKSLLERFEIKASLRTIRRDLAELEK